MSDTMSRSGCADCGKTHTFSEATGWYADGGPRGRHPWRAPVEIGKVNLNELVLMHHRYKPCGIATAFVVECVECYPPMLVSNARDSIRAHDGYHEKEK